MTRLTILLILITTMTISLAACDKNAPPAIPEELAIPVKLFQVEATNARLTRSYVARTDAVQTVDLSFQVGGTLIELPIKAGQFISKGDLLASLETGDFERRRKEAQVQLTLAKQKLQRKRSLYKQQGVSRSLLDDASASFKLQILALEKAEEDLQDAKLTAPFDAYVSKRHVDNFVNIRAGEPVVRLLDLTEIYIKFNVTEDILATVRADQITRAVARFPFAPDQQFLLTYRENSNEADSVAQTYEVTYAMPRSMQFNIVPGMTGNVEITVVTDRLNVEIPMSALVSNNDRSFSVWVLDKSTNRIASSPVEVGPATANAVSIVSGLNGGQTILSAGVVNAYEGMLVRPMD